MIDVKTGNPLAIASYPTFNAATVYEDWAELNAVSDDPNDPRPLYNYALQGVYAPAQPSSRLWPLRRSARAS